MQPAPFFLALGLFGAFNRANGNGIVEEHNDLTDGTGVLEAPAEVDAVAHANFKWPRVTVIKTQVDIVTSKPHWTTLTTVPMTHATTVTARRLTLTIPRSPTVDPLSLGTPLQVKRAESTSQTGHTVVIEEDPLGHRRTTTLAEPQPLPTIHISAISNQSLTATTTSSRTHTLAFLSPVTSKKDIVVPPSIKAAIPTTTPRVTGQTTALDGNNIVIPSGIEAVSITTVKLKTKFMTTHTKTTTTVPAKSGFLVVVTTHSTSTARPPPALTIVRHISDYFESKGLGPVPALYNFRCKKGWSEHHCLPLSKKWLWLLAIPVALLLLSIPVCIYAAWRFSHRRSRDEKQDYVAAPNPVQAPTVANDGGRQAEEGRGRTAFPADQHATQTVTTAPGGKVTTVPANTVQHVETVAPHDGAGSFDAGSLRSRGRGPLLMRF